MLPEEYFIEKSGFHKAVSVGAAVKSKPSGKGIVVVVVVVAGRGGIGVFCCIFLFVGGLLLLSRFFSAAGHTNALVKNYSGTHGANIETRKRRADIFLSPTPHPHRRSPVAASLVFSPQVCPV